MICKNCRPHFETDEAGPWAELCPKHALTDELIDALVEIESLCGGPTSTLMKKRSDIYEIAQPILEKVYEAIRGSWKITK